MSTQNDNNYTINIYIKDLMSTYTTMNSLNEYELIREYYDSYKELKSDNDDSLHIINEKNEILYRNEEIKNLINN